MSLPLAINNSLFWNYQGRIESSWYLCGDNADQPMRDEHMTWCLMNQCDGIIINMNNEELMTLFRNEYMRDLDWAKYQTFIGYLDKLKAAGAKIVPCFYDGPPMDHPKYPCLRHMDRHEAFITAACQTLNQYATAYLIGCETNRYWSSDTVRQAIAVTKQHAGLIPVGTHEQWNPHDREFPGGDFCCYEHSWHPQTGDDHSIQDCIDEIRHIQTHLPNGFPIWACEWNLNAGGSKSRAQARAMAELPGVVGIGGPG